MIPAGSLQDFTLSDLLQIISLNASTGTLRLESEGRNGVIGCRQGQILGARAGELAGDEAVYALFDWATGAFHFEAEAVDALPANVATSLDELAREGIRRLDQWRAIRTELPNLTTRALLRRHDSEPAKAPALSQGSRELLECLSPAQGQTLSELARALERSELTVALALLELQREGLLLVESAPEEALRATFKRISEGVFHRFASISGLKMIQGLEDHLNGLARERTWDIRWKNGQVFDGLAQASEGALLPIYRDCLADQLDYVRKLHGNPFLDRAVDQIAAEMAPEERASLALLGLLPVGS